MSFLEATTKVLSKAVCVGLVLMRALVAQETPEEQRTNHPLYSEGLYSLHRVDSLGRLERGSVGNPGPRQIIGPEPEMANLAQALRQGKEATFLEAGGIWIELPDFAEGVAFWLKSTESLPDLSMYGRVRLFHTIKASSGPQLRKVAEFEFGEGGKDVFLPADNIGLWLLALQKQGKVQYADYIQANPGAPSSIYRSYLWMKTKPMRPLWEGTHLEPEQLEDRTDPRKSEGYWLEDLSKPGVLVFYPLDEPLPKPEKEATLNIYHRTNWAGPLLQLTTETYLEGALTGELLPLREPMANAPVPVVRSDASMFAKPFEIREAKPDQKNLVDIRMEEANGKFIFYLPGDVISDLGDRAEVDLRLRKKTIEAMLPPGVWYRLPGMNTPWRRVSLDHEFPVGRLFNLNEPIQIALSLLPKPDLEPVQTLADLYPGGDVKPLSKALPSMRIGGADGAILRSMIRGSCDEGLSAAGKALPKTSESSGH